MIYRETQQIYPLDEEELHTLAGLECYCRPTILKKLNHPQDHCLEFAGDGIDTDAYNWGVELNPPRRRVIMVIHNKGVQN